MEQGRFILSLDSGTTSCRALLFDHKGEIFASAQQEITLSYPHPGWVEQDATELWRLQRDVMHQAARAAEKGEIVAIGIANQRETTILWDRVSGEPLAPAIVWQCRRSQALCERLKSEGKEPFVRSKTGLVLDPYFSATKIAWLLDNVPNLREKAERGDALFGTVDSWLLWNLSREAGRHPVHVTDQTNASRTLLYNLATGDWDDELLALFGIPRAILPEIRPSSEFFCEAMPYGEGRLVPVYGVAGDQQAALFGQACFTSGMAKNTYGTGCFLLMNVGSEAPDPIRIGHGLLVTAACGIGGARAYALEGSVFVAGAAVQWLRDGLGIIAHAAETEALARSLTDNGGVYFVPSFTGLGTPYWEPSARGTITGLTRGATRSHIARAALESIAFQSKAVCQAMSDAGGVPLTLLRVDGGATENGFLMQFQSDILGASVARATVRETTARGAAFLAGLASGFWRDTEALSHLWTADQIFHPSLDEDARQALLHGWEKAVQGTCLVGS
jgi:glycerol kinase